MEVKLHVGNLSYETSEEDLNTLFAQAGTVASVSLIKDRDTGQSKGFAFVEMTTEAEAQKAISLYNGHKMNDREITVSLAKPREARSGDQNRVKTGNAPKPNAFNKTQKEQGGYQSKLGAFGKSGKSSGPTDPRRRGGSQHY